jgi:hypothetical protein
VPRARRSEGRLGLGVRHGRAEHGAAEVELVQADGVARALRRELLDVVPPLVEVHDAVYEEHELALPWVGTGGGEGRVSLASSAPRAVGLRQGSRLTAEHEPRCSAGSGPQRGPARPGRRAGGGRASVSAPVRDSSATLKARRSSSVRVSVGQSCRAASASSPKLRNHPQLSDRGGPAAGAARRRGT